MLLQIGSHIDKEPRPSEIGLNIVVWADFFMHRPFGFTKPFPGLLLSQTMGNPDNARRCSFCSMLTALRTYRLLSTLLGLSLLFGVVSPLVQTACAMGQNDLHGAHDCRPENTHSHASTDAPAPPCTHKGESTHEGVVPSSFDAPPCCVFESASTSEAVVLLSRTSWRSASSSLLALLPHTGYEAPDNISTLPRISASPFFTGFPLIDRQALLATFLI